MEQQQLRLEDLPGSGAIEITPRLSIIPASRNYKVPERNGSITYKDRNGLHLLHFYLVNGLTKKSDASIFDGHYLCRLALQMVRERFHGVCTEHQVTITRVQFDPHTTGIVGDI